MTKQKIPNFMKIRQTLVRSDRTIKGLHNSVPTEGPLYLICPRTSKKSHKVFEKSRGNPLYVTSASYNNHDKYIFTNLENSQTNF